MAKHYDIMMIELKHWIFVTSMRAVASATQPGGRKKLQVGPNIYHLF